MTKLVSNSDHNHAGLMSQSLRAAFGQLQDNRPLFQYVIGISGILPYQHVSRALKFFFPPAEYSLLTNVHFAFGE